MRRVDVDPLSGPSLVEDAATGKYERMRGLISLTRPHMLWMTQWTPPKREPAKTKDQLREMLAEAVRNTAQPKPKPPPKAKKDRGQRAEAV